MKTAKQLGLTPTQYKNLAKLTVYVRDKVAPPKFDISSFFDSKKSDECSHSGGDVCPSVKEYECGTTACFLGYGIPAGIKAHKNETWGYYGERAFGVEMAGSDLYDLLFDASHVNSKMAAAKRGAWFLMNGFPENNDYLYSWETPRSFKPDWDAIEKIANS
jgi:hypothetical protein